ncbi:MAG: C40 family peptidase [Clostridiales bacterium]|jgi:cell wall-associated NlpC family hydrolase|nr:C40 family peptidase [Clostridiales bacterium]MDR2749765.1 C40 family peptidase [Clostridiales bacterium]
MKKRSRTLEASKYVMVGALVTVGSATTAFAATDAVVNSDRVYVQTATDSSAAVIMLINQGAPLTVTAEKDRFYQVVVDGIENMYVEKEYVDLQGEPDFPDITEEAAPEEFLSEEAGDEEIGDAALEGEAPAALEVPAEQGEATNVSGATEAAAPKLGYAVVLSESGLNLRIDASGSAEVITALDNGTAVDIIDTGAEWTKVQYGTEVGYMATEYLAIKEGAKPEQPIAVTSKGEKFVEYAKQFMGTPYVWGGTNLSRGVDCSGFVYSVYKHFGITLNRTSRSMPNDGYRVKKADLQKGDLVFFDTSGSNNGAISHVGMYIGNGQFIHSSSGKKRGVTISSLGDSYYTRTYVTAARVL